MELSVATAIPFSALAAEDWTILATYLDVLGTQTRRRR